MADGSNRDGDTIAAQVNIYTVYIGFRSTMEAEICHTIALVTSIVT